MNSQFSPEKLDFSLGGIIPPMLVVATALGGIYEATEDLAFKDYFVVQDIIASKTNEANQIQWDESAIPTEIVLHDGFLPNTLQETQQETHATSADIQKQIMAGIDRQLHLADEEERDVVISKPSKSNLFNFAKMHKITRTPFVILRDNGNLSASWKYENGNKFKLIFLKDGSLNYVAFLNRPEKRATLHGNDTIMGVMNFIQSNEIIL